MRRKFVSKRVRKVEVYICLALGKHLGVTSWVLVAIEVEVLKRRFDIHKTQCWVEKWKHTLNAKEELLKIVFVIFRAVFPAVALKFNVEVVWGSWFITCVAISFEDELYPSYLNTLFMS